MLGFSPIGSGPLGALPVVIITAPEPPVVPPIPVPPIQVAHVDLVPIPPNTTAGPAETGSFRVMCAVCGFKITATTAKKRWDGLIVCQQDWEPRHSLDFIRARTKKVHVTYAPPEPSDVFVEIACPYPTQYAMADIGTADCSMADRITTTL